MGRAARIDVFGRGVELAGLAAGLAGLRAGRGGIVWLEGEPGIGKSTLVDVLVADAQAALFAVFSAAGDELMEAFPLRLMAECLGASVGSPDPARVEIARLLRGEVGAGGFDPVLAASERMLEVVDRFCADRPVVLIVEDLHWADEPSLLVWNRLARSVDQIPLLLVGTCRPVPERTTVRRLRGVVGDRSGLVIDLGPLDSLAVARIAAGLVGRPGPRLAGQLVRAGGNPFYVRELVEALVREGQVEVRGDGWAEFVGGGDQTPDSLPATIGSRLRFLSGRTLQALRSAALLGVEFDARSWEVVQGRSAAELALVLEEAIAGGVVSSEGARLRFRHALIWEVLVEQTPVAIRAGVHAQFAQSLAAEGCELDVVASQLLAAPQDMSAWALDWLAGLSESQIYAALGVSIELLARALKTVTAADPRWEALATRLTLAWSWLGGSGSSAAGVSAESIVDLAGQVAGRTSDVQLAARMRVIASRGAGRLQRYSDALSYSTLTEADDQLPDLWRGRLNAWAAMALRYLDRTTEARLRAKEAILDAQRSGDALTMAHANFVLARISSPDEAMKYIDAGLADSSDDPESLELHAQLLGLRLYYAARLGLPEERTATQARARVVADRPSSYQSVGILITLAEFAYEAGQWDEPIQRAVAVSELFPHVRLIARDLAAVVAIQREQHQAAEAHLVAAGYPDQLDTTPANDVTSSQTRTPPGFLPGVYAAFGLKAEASGDLDRALQWRRKWLDLPQPWKEEYCQMVPDLVRVAVALGDTATAQAAVEACEAVDLVFPNNRHAARCSRALLDGDARQLLQLAEECRQRFQWIVLAAMLQEVAAVRLADNGDTAAARTAFNAAVTCYDTLGATWNIRRASAALRPYGIRRGPHSPHRSATSGWAALTPAERRIAELVARGLSNPDIARDLLLSRNTVQTHVSSILAKLSLKSRLEIGRHLPAETDHTPTSRPGQDQNS